MSARRRWVRPGAELPAWKRALSLLAANNGPLSAGSVAIALGGTASGARAVLEALVRRGEAERINRGEHTLYRASTPVHTEGVDHAG